MELDSSDKDKRLYEFLRNFDFKKIPAKNIRLNAKTAQLMPLSNYLQIFSHLEEMLKLASLPKKANGIRLVVYADHLHSTGNPLIINSGCGDFISGYEIFYTIERGDEEPFFVIKEYEFIVKK